MTTDYRCGLAAAWWWMGWRAGLLALGALSLGWLPYALWGVR